MRIAAILLAAGRGERFIGNKLLENYAGKTLYLHTLDLMLAAGFHQVVVVTQYQQIIAHVSGTRARAVHHPDPSLGISSSIRIGLQNCGVWDGVMFFVGDQPHLSLHTVAGMIEMFKSEPSCIISAAYGDCPGNPVIFPWQLKDELMALKGDIGGRAVIWNHPDILRYYMVSNPVELKDIDTREDLDNIAGSAGNE